MPCATITQTLPRSLHSMQTLCPGVAGRRPCSNALTVSINWCFEIGQPRSSKSTGTWSAIGVEVASVSI